MKNVPQTGLISKAQKTLHIAFVNTMSLSLGLATFTANTDYTEDYSHFVCHNQKHKILCKPLYTDLRLIPTFAFFRCLVNNTAMSPYCGLRLALINDSFNHTNYDLRRPKIQKLEPSKETKTVFGTVITSQ